MRGSSEVAMLGDLDLAIIGCGAIANSYYFPVLSADVAAGDYGMTGKGVALLRRVRRLSASSR